MRETPAGSDSGMRPSQGQSRCGKGPSISIYFACKLVSSGYAYPLNIAESLYIQEWNVATRVWVALAITENCQPV